jgi:hypothetical protein
VVPFWLGGGWFFVGGWFCVDFLAILDDLG